MITVTSILFNPVDYPDSATSYLDGCIGDRYKAVISFYFQKGTAIANAYDLLAGVITVKGVGDNPPTENFITDGFQIGETVTLPGSVTNLGTIYTITAVTAT